MRYALAALLLFTLAAPAHAQLGLNLIGGAGSSTVLLEDEDAGDAERRFGYHAGAGLTLPLTAGLSLRFDAVYVQKGAVLDAGEPGFPVEASVDLSYFELAPSVTVGNEHVYAIGGPWFAFKSSCDISITAAGMSIEQECGEDTLDIKGTDYGVAGGLGVKFPLVAGLTLGLEGIYSAGLASVSDEDSDGGAKHQSLRGRVVITLPLGG